MWSNILENDPSVGKVTSVVANYSQELFEKYKEEDKWRSLNFFDSNDEIIGKVSLNGVITLNVSDSIRLDITLDGALRLHCYNHNIVICAAATGNSNGLLHPNGRIYQHGGTIDICNSSNAGGNKYVKISTRRLTFTSDRSESSYLVEKTGTKEIWDIFSNLNNDFTTPMFYHMSNYGLEWATAALHVIDQMKTSTTNNGMKCWAILQTEVNAISICRMSNGFVFLRRGDNFYLEVLPLTGFIRIKTPTYYATARVLYNRFMYVCREERKVYSCEHHFIVENGKQCWGFDDKERVVPKERKNYYA